ncbi:MAG: YncE family protein [Nitrososphaeraceae archaeon]
MIKKLDAFCKSIPSLLVVMLVALLVSGTALGLETASAKSMIKNINISNTPLGVAFNPSNGYTYATNKDLGTVSVIDSSTNTVIDTIPMDERTSIPISVRLAS